MFGLAVPPVTLRRPGSWSSACRAAPGFQSQPLTPIVPVPQHQTNIGSPMWRRSVDGHGSNRCLVAPVDDQQEAVGTGVKAALISQATLHGVVSEALVAEACDFCILQPAQILISDVRLFKGAYMQAVRGELHKRAMIEILIKCLWLR